jgi:hypothetical protein
MRSSPAPARAGRDGGTVSQRQSEMEQRQHVEAVLSESELRYQATFDLAGVGIVHTSFEAPISGQPQVLRDARLPGRGTHRQERLGVFPSR